MPYNPYGYPNLPVQPTVPAQAQYPYMNMPQVGQQMPAQQNQMAEPLSNGGLIFVPTEEDAKRYPIAPGHLVTFRIENQPIIVEKSMSRSQFAMPHYKRYRLVEENMQDDSQTPASRADENKPLPGHDEVAELKKKVEQMSVQIDVLKDNYADIKKSFKANKNKENDA